MKDDKSKEEDKSNPFAGIFIFAREIKNDGKIESKGETAVTHIKTEKYSGGGTVLTQPTGLARRRFEKWWGILALGIMASTIVVIVFYYL